MLVVTCLTNVSNPLNWLVVALFLHSAVPNPEATTSKHRNLKLLLSRLTVKSSEMGALYHCLPVLEGIS